MDEKIINDLPFTYGEENTEAKALLKSVQTNSLVQSFDWFNFNEVVQMAKIAERLAKSAFCPVAFKNDTYANLIALEMCSRTGTSLLEVYQNMYVVNGKPSWSGKYCLSALRRTGLYKKVRLMKILNKNQNAVPNAKDGALDAVFGYQVIAEDYDGEIIEGTPITWDTVVGFGWNEKSGSMWNIPGQRVQMYKYRAAEYFLNSECPEILGGLYSQYAVADTDNKYSEVILEED